MEAEIVSAALTQLKALREGVKEPWEKAVFDVGLSLLTRYGVETVKVLEETLGVRSRCSPEELSQMIAVGLPIRESSNLLAALQNGEADRVKRSRELLQKVMAVVVEMTNAILKIALAEGLP
jgi:hypothetical protein